VSLSEGAAPTLRDVGARAGVSAMTASRALRGDPMVAPTTRKRVQAAAAALGYRRNELARSLRVGSTSGMTGLIVPNLANPFYSELALGVETAVARRGMKVVLSNTGGDPVKELEIVDDLAARRVDGIIVVPAGGDQSHLDPARLHDTPVVLAARPADGVGVDCVLLDDFGGAREAVAKLIDGGHRRIGFLGPPAAWTTPERLRGFRSASASAGLVPDEQLVRCEQRDITSAEHAADRMLALPQPPTAFFCSNSRNTLGACRAVQRRGTDTAVSGFDDFEVADMIGMSLRLVTYQPEAMGRQAAELLLGRIDEARGEGGEKAAARRVTLQTAVREYTPVLPRTP
jgi:LacI family transcriptional regulator, galactose operon repressor